MINFDTKWLYRGSLADDLEEYTRDEAKGYLKEQADKIDHSMWSRLSQFGRGIKWPSLPNRSSAPGDPPAMQSGALRYGVSARVVVFKYVYRLLVESDVWRDYGRRMELGGFGGGVYIAPRPFIRPAIREAFGQDVPLEIGGSEDDDVG